MSLSSIEPPKILEETDPLKTSYGSTRAGEIETLVVPDSEIIEPETMAEARVREPSVFHGTQEEDGQDWLERFEELADMNKWKGANKLTCVKSYLEGTARKWFRIKKPASWEDFREKFLMAFEFKNFLFKVETRLMSRRQGLNGPIETYFYDVLSLCTQLEEESETEMSELTKVNYLLNGLTPTLLDRLWPLVPEPINSTGSLLAAALKHAQAREMMASIQPKAFPSRQNKREDSDTEESDLKEMIRQLKKDLDATNRKLDARQNWQPNFKHNEYQRNNYEQPRKQTRFVNENPRFQQTNRFQSNRTTDGRPICNICRKPGHIARFCKSRNEEYPRAVNALHAIGKSLVKKEVLCNGIKAEALIDTGAALTAVRAICEWMRKIQMRLDRSRNFPRKRRNDMASLRNPRQYQDWTKRSKRRSHRNAATEYRYSDRKRSAETIRQY